MMACAMKFSAGAVRNQLRHNRRTIEHSSNRDIDPERLEHDYVPQKTSPKAISKAIAKVGHDTDMDKADKAVYDKLPACCHYR